MLKALAAACVGALAVVLVLELALRVLPTSTATRSGYHIDPNILTYPPGHTFRTSFGWALERAQQHRANNLGFVSDHDFVVDPRAVAVIGDSFVEASMLPPADRIGARFEAALEGRPVYAMGGPGSSLLDYVERVRLAHRLGVRDIVIVVERGDIAQAVCGSGNVHAVCIDRATLAPRHERVEADESAAKAVLRRSALAQYLFSQLKLSPQALAARAASVFAGSAAPVRPAELPEAATDAVLREFFLRLAPYRDRRFVFVMGCDLPTLQAGRSIVHPPSRSKFMAQARAFGATVIDSEALFRDHLDRGGLSLQVSPRDGHWNRLANALVAEAAIRSGIPKTEQNASTSP